jgi:hypothetical protein
MAASSKSTKSEPSTPSVPAPEPSPQVPEPTPAPEARTAPHIAAGVAADIKANGWAVDPFTGVTLTADDLT